MPSGTSMNRRVRATLTTIYGRTGMLWLDSVVPVASDGDDAVAMAMLEVVAADGSVIEGFAITGEAWQVFQADADMRDFLDDVRTSASLESCLRAQLDDMENQYEHEECGETWVDHHSCGCDDECPTCGVAISPHDSIQIKGLNDETPAGYVDMLAIAPVPSEAPVAVRQQSRTA